MRTRFLIIAVTALVHVAAGCATTDHSLSKADSSGSLKHVKYEGSPADVKAVTELVQTFEAAWNKSDMALLATIFDADANWINVVGMHWRGRDAVIKAHAVFHEIMFKDCKLRSDHIDVRFVDATHAVAVWTATQDSFKTPSGEVMPSGQTRCTFVAAKRPEGWRVVHGHNVHIDAAAAKHDPVNANFKP